MTAIHKAINKFACMLLASLVLITGIVISTQQVDAAALNVQLHMNGHIYYDNGRAYTVYKWVTWEEGGKTYRRDAYCMQPSKGAPPEKKYTAQELSMTNDISQCLYFANGAPGEEDFTAAMKKKGYSDYVSTKDQRYGFMHIILSYAYQGSTAFKILGGGSLSDRYQNAVKAAYKWCLSRDLPKSAAFDVYNGTKSSPKRTLKATFDASKGKFVTKDFHVTGPASQSFEYTVPKKATLYYKTSSTATKYKKVAAGKTVTIKQGYYFHFEIEPTATSGFTSTVKGNLRSLEAFKITAASSKQDLAFYGKSELEKATFKVTLTPLAFGEAKIKKVYKEYGETETHPEEGAVFRVYNASFKSYEDALDANTKSTPYTATLTTGSDGTAISRKLAVNVTNKGNVYKVEQKSGKAGYKLVADTTVTLVKDKTVSIKTSSGSTTFINEGFPYNIQITKLSERTDELIAATGSNAAQFTVYTDEECTQSVEVITCDNGVGRLSQPLAPGVYFVKETRAPSYNGINYSLDETVHKVTLSPTSCTTEGEGNDTVYIKELSCKDKEVSKHNLIIGKKTMGDIPQTKEFSFTANLNGLEENKTYSYVKLDKATYEGMKSYFTDIEGYNFKDNAYNFLRNSDYTLSDMRTDLFTPYAASGQAVQVQTVTSNANGEANIAVSLKNGDAVIVFELPQSASYRVSEAGTTAGDIQIEPSYKINAPEGAANLSSNEADPGETLTTRWETFPAKDAKTPDGKSTVDYPVGVEYTNDGTVHHKLVVEKEVAGAGMDKSKSYDFALKLRFAGIFAQQPLPDTYEIPGYAIVGHDEDGNQITVKKVDARTSPVTGSDTQIYNFSLKAGEKLVMTGIPNDTYYTLAEKTGDYIRSSKTYQYAAGSSDKGGSTNVTLPNSATFGTFNNGNIVSGGDTSKLNYSSTISATTEVDVTNTAPANKDNTTSKIVLKKDANTVTNENFTFNVKVDLPDSYDGSTLPTYYAVGKGTETYQISISGGKITIGNGSKTIKVPVTITRSDGKAATLPAGNIGPDTYIDEGSTVLAQWLTAPLLSESWGDDIQNVPFTVNWMGVQTEMVLSYGSGSTSISIPQNRTDGEANKASVSNISIQDIVPNGSGSTVTLKAGEKLSIEGLLPGTTYKITEPENAYKPSYTITRKSSGQSGESVLGEDQGMANESLSTSPQKLPENGACTDTAAFMNEKDTDDLSVRKETSDQNATKQFNYTVDLYGASPDGTETYKAVIPGNKTFDISIDVDGNMQISQTQGSTTDLSGIPVKIIRPDKKAKTLRTDQNGMINAADYATWLRETEQHDTFDFTVMFLGTEVTMTCNQ